MHPRLLPTALFVALSPLTLTAQSTPQCDAATKAANNGTCPAAAPKSPAQKFPYPGDHPDADPPAISTPSANPAQKFPYPGDNPSQGAPADDTPPPSATPPASDSGGTPETPQFPGSLPRYQRNPDPTPGTSGSSASSSSSSSSSSDDGNTPLGPDALKDAGSSAEDAVKPTHHTPKAPKKAPKPETPDSRADKDLSVAAFYMNDKNYVAAYARAKDAIEIIPDDPSAHLAVAEAARKLGKLDEAKSEYLQVLKLDPIPKQARAAKEALAEMEGHS